MTGRASEISAADERSEGSSANAGRSESVIPYIARRYVLLVRMGRGLGRGRQWERSHISAPADLKSVLLSPTHVQSIENKVPQK